MTTIQIKASRYSGFGFIIQSDIQLRELTVFPDAEPSFHILIEKRDLSSLWQEHSVNGRSFVINENFVLFHIKTVGIFLVSKGNEIFYSPEKNADDDLIRLYLLGSCMGAILMQRKILPLHGSAFAFGGKAYAIVGDSGAGKSTLASALINRGCSLLTDDVIPVTFHSNGIPYVTPAYPHQKLWLSSLDAFGMNAEKYSKIFNRETKYSVPVVDHYESASLPLAGIFELTKTESAEIRFRPLSKLHCLQTLFKHTYRNFYLANMNLIEWHFATSASLAEKIMMYQLERPEAPFTALELADQILVEIKGGVSF
ncbi:aldolase [Metabacillus sp. JX24]|uniref:aldolase n=1 Tax=Metabacillus sp. JX24 TaxID=3240759 RepID=UPI00350F7B07